MKDRCHAGPASVLYSKPSGVFGSSFPFFRYFRRPDAKPGSRPFRKSKISDTFSVIIFLVDKSERMFYYQYEHLFKVVFACFKHGKDI